MRLKLKKAILDSGAFTLALPSLPSCSLALTKFIIKVYSTVEQYCGLERIFSWVGCGETK